MAQKFLKKIFGDPNRKLLAQLQKDVEKINALEPEFVALSDDQLKVKTKEFKDRFGKGETLEDLAFEAFATVRETARRTIGQRHYDVQLIGGLTLHNRGIAEMRTGEGKTLTSTLPLYLNALAGKGCHLITVNDYLAKRDAVWMAQIFHALGLSVACVTQESGYIYDPDFKLKEGSEEEEKVDEERDATGSFEIQMDYLRPCERKEAYDCDITYGTNNQFGFDYLRDNMAPTNDQKVQRDLHYCIIDEVDSILIDEARTPLIISAPAEESNQLYVRFAHIIRSLTENEDYNVDEKMRTATLSEAGMTKIEQALGIENLYGSASNLQHHADSALKAQAVYKRDVNYVVQNGEVVIVDEFTGRLQPGRRFSGGIHQAIEAKEGVDIKRESLTLATITFQNFFRMYDKLSGMTGTAETEIEEFDKIYGLDVLVIPTHKPIARKDLVDRIYKNEIGKMQAVIQEVRRLHESGQPVLIGTASVEKNELFSELLKREGIPFNALNAKNHESEAEYIAQAGRVGAVTLATNMAGRGVDIQLGGTPQDPAEAEKVKELGGLHVLGTERHESRRIDNQLRGRAGRQGDPGSTQFYVSMEDDLMRIFASDRVKGMMDRLGIPDDMPIENKMVTSSIEKAQERVEGHHFDTRKHLLEYDDVLNKHRQVIYDRRNELLDAFHGEDKTVLKNLILQLIEEEVEQVVLFHTGEVIDSETKKQNVGDWNVKEILETIQTIVPLKGEKKNELEALTAEVKENKMDIATERTKLIEAIMEIIRGAYLDLEDLFENRDDLHNIERAVMLRAVDTLWIDHLAAMTGLRTGIGLRGYGQRDPLVEYKKEAYGMYQSLLGKIDQEIVYGFFTSAGRAVDIRAQQDLVNRSLLQRAGVRLMGAVKTQGNDRNESNTSSTEPKVAKVGRNDLCPCGSGKKYKKCHGA